MCWLAKSDKEDGQDKLARLMIEAMMEMRLRIVGLAIGVTLVSMISLKIQAQEIRVRSVGDDIFIEGPGIWKKLVLAEGEYKEGVSLSPDGRRIIYHDKFDPYKPPPLPQPATTFTVIDVETGKVVHKIPLYWGSNRRGRFLYAIEWITERLILVLGEGSLALLDVEEGTQIHNLWGSLFSVAPDRRKIIFNRGTPPIYFHEDYRFFLSDYVMLAFVDKGKPIMREDVSSNLTAMTVYPEIAPFGKWVERSYGDLHERHFIKSGFCWSADSQRVAFVEEHRRVFWLVVLALDVKDSEVKAVPRRFKLAEKVGEVSGIEWTEDHRAIKVFTQEGTYVVDLEKGTVSVR